MRWQSPYSILKDNVEDLLSYFTASSNLLANCVVEGALIVFLIDWDKVAWSLVMNYGGNHGGTVTLWLQCHVFVSLRHDAVLYMLCRF